MQIAFAAAAVVKIDLSAAIRQSCPLFVRLSFAQLLPRLLHQSSNLKFRQSELEAVHSSKS